MVFQSKLEAQELSQAAIFQSIVPKPFIPTPKTDTQGTVVTQDRHARYSILCCKVTCQTTVKLSWVHNTLSHQPASTVYSVQSSAPVLCYVIRKEAGEVSCAEEA